MVNLDRNTPRILRGWLPELVSAKEVCCHFIAYRAVLLSSCLLPHQFFNVTKELAGVFNISILVLYSIVLHEEQCRGLIH
jgi:hypothetical protein